jgi:hypothetical protein
MMGNEGGNTFFCVKLQSCCGGWEEYCIWPHQPPSSHRIQYAGEICFCNISAHCLSPPSRICYELYTGRWLSIRAACDAKIQEKPLQQYQFIYYRYYMQCEWYLNVKLCTSWCIPSICAQDAHRSLVLYGGCLNLLHQACKLVLSLKSTEWASPGRRRQTIWCLMILLVAWCRSIAQLVLIIWWTW